MTYKETESKINYIGQKVGIEKCDFKMRSLIALSLKRLGEQTVDRCVDYAITKKDMKNPIGYLRNALNYELDKVGR